MKRGQHMKQRWQTHRQELLTAIQPAAAVTGAAVLKKRWERDREGMLSIVKKANAASQPKMLGRVLSGRCEAGLNHHRCAVWRLRDPRGVGHEFKNLSHFIRCNPHLFDPEDCRIRTLKAGSKHGTSRAISGLSQLRPSVTRARVLASWKGWTWISIGERRVDEGRDLLERQSI